MYQYSQYQRASRFPPVVKNLLIINGLIFLAQMLPFTSYLLMRWFALWPLSDGFWIWQLASYGFLHGGFWHLAMNMFALWMFGSQIENTWGARRFALFYFVCVVGAGLVQLIVSLITGGTYPTVGASGGVFGLLLAFGMLFPNQHIMLLFPPIPMRAKYFVLLFGILEFISATGGLQPGVANWAHLGGMFFGYFLIVHWRSQPPGSTRHRESEYAHSNFFNNKGRL